MSSIRFRDLLPAAHESSPEPLFTSPQQTTRVLHSIFSPNYKATNALDRPQNENTQSDPTTFSQTVSPEIHPQSTALLLPGTAPRTAPDAPTQATTNPSKFRAIKQQRKHAKQPPKSPKPSSRIVPEIWVSPCHTTAMSSIGIDASMSVLSHKTTISTTTAFRTLEKMEWLKLESIEGCDSVQQLVRVVTALESNGNRFPALHRAATTRLQYLRAELTATGTTTAASSLHYSTASSSSLIMSFSTEEECSIIQQHDGALVNIMENEVKPGYSPVMAGNSPNNEKEQYRINQQILVNQINELTDKVIAMGTEQKQEEDTRIRNAEDRANQLENKLQQSTATEQAYRRKLLHMNSLLKSAQAKLLSVKGDRDAMTQCLLSVTGRSTSTGNVHELLSNFSQRTVATQRSLAAMTKALAQADAEQRTAVRDQKATQERWTMAQSDLYALRRENQRLVADIAMLSDELEATRHKMDQVYNNANGWKEREIKYKAVIREMKHELSKRENVVPVRLYQKAVAESKSARKECLNQQQEIGKLAEKVLALSDIMAVTQDKRVSPQPQAQPEESNVVVEQQSRKHPPPVAATKPERARGLSSMPQEKRLERPRQQRVNVVVEQPPTHRPVVTTKPERARVLSDKSQEKRVERSQQQRVNAVEQPSTSRSVTTTKPERSRVTNSENFVVVEPDQGKENAPYPKTPRSTSRTTPRSSKPKVSFAAQSTNSNNTLTLNFSPKPSKSRASAVKAAGGRLGLQQKLRELRSSPPTHEPEEPYQQRLSSMKIRPRPLVPKN